MFWLGGHFFFTHCPAAVHWQTDWRVKNSSRQAALPGMYSKNEEVIAMNSDKQFFLGRAILLGSFGLAMTLFSAQSSKAQETSPDHFTDTGVQNVHENGPSTPVKATAAGSKQRQVRSQARENQKLILINGKKHARVARQKMSD